MSLYSEYNDYILINLINTGDEAAYTEVFNRYGHLLIAHAFHILGSKEDAKDIVHDVMLRMWENRETLKIKISLSSYLFKSVRNSILNYLSHQAVKEKYTASFNAFMKDYQEESISYLDEKEMDALIQKEINLLPDKMREVFILRRTQELSYEEISHQLNITEQTARQQVYNAVKILKRKLNTIVRFLLFL